MTRSVDRLIHWCPLLLAFTIACHDSSPATSDWIGEITTSGDTTTVHTTSGSLLGDLGAIPAESLEVLYAGDGVLRSTVVATGGDRVLIGEGTQIVVIDSTAAVDTLGREGGGPGEFRRILDVRFLGDTIEALDQNASRLTRIAPDGSPTLLTVNGPEGFEGLRGSRLSHCQAATMLTWNRGFVSRDGPQDSVAVVWWTPGVPPTAWWFVPDMRWTAFGNAFGPRFPFGPRVLITSDGGCRVAATDGVAYVIPVRQLGSDSVTIISADEPRVPVGAEAKTIPERWRSEWSTSGLPTVLGLVEAQDYSDARNQVDDIQFDDRDRLWVRVVDSTYRYHPWVMSRVADARPSTYRWDVFGTDGRRLAIVHLPSSFTPKAWAGRWVYGISEDEDGAMVVGRLPVPEELE